VSGEPYVGFLVGGEPFALEAARVIAVAGALGVIPVPFARRAVAGVIVRRGRLVPVVDLCRVPSLWNEMPEGAGDRVVILATGEIEAGFLTSDVETFRAAGPPEPGGTHPPAPSRAREAILCGALRSAGRTYGLLRIESALADAGLPVGGS